MTRWSGSPPVWMSFIRFSGNWHPFLGKTGIPTLETLLGNWMFPNARRLMVLPFQTCNNPNLCLERLEGENIKVQEYVWKVVQSFPSLPFHCNVYITTWTLSVVDIALSESMIFLTMATHIFPIFPKYCQWLVYKYSTPLCSTTWTLSVVSVVLSESKMALLELSLFRYLIMVAHL